MASGTTVTEISATPVKKSASFDIVIHGRNRPPAIDRDIPRQIARVDDDGVNTYNQIGYFGMGSFGNCYEYQELGTNAKYAVKVIRKFRSETPPSSDSVAKRNAKKHTELAYREGSIQEPLRHQNIVRFFNAFDDEEFVYLLMEPCVRKSLDDVIRNRGRLSIIETRYYIRQLSSGCQYLRENLVLHRDLKPANLFIDKNLVLKIGDFGLAKKLKDITEKSLSLCGTVNYMAPEMVSNVGHGIEVDMWAVGCILFELMVGQPPFARRTQDLTFEAILEAKDLPIPFNIVIPSSALALMFKLLFKNPKSRLIPDEILKSKFMRKGPSIPRRLPSSLLSHLPAIPGYNTGRKVLSLEQVIENIISRSSEPEYEPESGPSEHASGSGAKHEPSEHASGFAAKHEPSEHASGFAAKHEPSEYASGPGAEHEPSEHASGPGAEHEPSEHASGPGAKHEPSEHASGPGAKHEPSEHASGPGAKHEPSEHASGPGAKHEPSEHASGPGAKHEPREHASGPGAKHEPREHASGPGAKHEPSEHASGPGAKHEPSEHASGPGAKHEPSEHASGPGAKHEPSEHASGPGAKHEPSEHASGPGSEPESRVVLTSSTRNDSVMWLRTGLS